MHPLDQFKRDMPAYLPGLLVLYDIADAKRRNCHLGCDAVDRDIVEMEQLVRISVGPSGLAKRVAGDKCLALYKSDSLMLVTALLSNYHTKQELLVGWQCTGEKDGQSKTTKRVVRATIVRSLRCLYSFTDGSQEPAQLIELLLEHIHWSLPGIPCSLADAMHRKAAGWSCVSTYPDEMPFCPFCKGTDFEWIDGDGSVYSGSCTCKACEASITIGGIQLLPS